MSVTINHRIYFIYCSFLNKMHLVSADTDTSDAFRAVYNDGKTGDAISFFDENGGAKMVRIYKM